MLRSRPNQRYFHTKVIQMEVSTDNICFPPLENELSSLKGNSMQLRVTRLCRGGRWYLYLAVPQRPGKRFKGISNGCRVMRRLSCSSTMTRQAVRQRRKQQTYYHLARSRSLTYKAITKMRQMPYQPVTRKRFVEAFGTQGHTVQMGSLKDLHS